MKYIIVFLSLTLRYGTFGKDLRIIGGSNANVTEFSYSVSLKDYEDDDFIINKHFCGGAIISERHVVTAAHCMYPYQDNENVIRIYTTEYSADNVDVPYYTIEHFILHPDFLLDATSIFKKNSDICVIKIRESFVFSSTLKKIDLPTEEPEEGSMGTLSGWGASTYPNEFYPDKLQAVTLKVQKRATCLLYLPFSFHSGQFCALHSRGVGSCFGDSGSPLVFNNKLGGIVSFSIPCGSGIPDIFTKVHFFLEFIAQSMEK